MARQAVRSRRKERKELLEAGHADPAPAVVGAASGSAALSEYLAAIDRDSGHCVICECIRRRWRCPRQMTAGGGTGAVTSAGG
ncbi:hypothetical protein GCM10027452_03400 [Micromonospora halotolerans]